MMLPQCSHITLKRGVYYYRRRLPRPLTSEITLSLRTRCYLEAQWRARLLDEEFRRTIGRVDNNKNTDIPLRANDGETSDSRKFSLTWA